ncbi:response regulator transcription factor [Peptoniphilus sp.]|uniref:response regulator transcription factor n=1 Tax=Peptoniphilus sp. TaxID=1971214 RepID=UPI003995C5E4
MRIAIIEDEEDIRKLIEYALSTQGFEVSTFEKGSDFFKTEIIPDIILLDIMLPGMNGQEILKKIRDNTKFDNTLVIMLTAKSAEMDVVSCLEAGADDYIKKPFGVMELISRVKAHIRRIGREVEEIEVRDIKIDTKRRTVIKGEEEISLTYKEFELLKYLAENKSIVLSRENIIEKIWGYDYLGETRTVDMHIASLRQKIGEDYIITIRGVGYKME